MCQCHCCNCCQSPEMAQLGVIRNHLIQLHQALARLDQKVNELAAAVTTHTPAAPPE